jgi:hypothetical protein
MFPRSFNDQLLSFDNRQRLFNYKLLSFHYHGGLLNDPKVLLNDC